MWSMVTLPRDMRCPGYLNFWGRLIVFGKLMTFKLQTFTFLQNDGVILPHVPFIQIPWRSTRRSRHFRLHRLRQATAGSFRWSNLVVAASHPTAGQDQQCLSIWTWMKLNSKLQSSTLYTIYDLLCLINKVKHGVSWIHSIHFEVANMPNVPTHSPEIPLRRKFSCLSARVVWSSRVSAMIAAASRSPQFSICTSLAPLRSSASASPFLSGVPYIQPPPPPPPPPPQQQPEQV